MYNGDEFEDFDVDAFDSIKREEESKRGQVTGTDTSDKDDNIYMVNQTRQFKRDVHRYSDYNDRQPRYEDRQPRYEDIDYGERSHNVLAILLAIIITAVFSILLTWLFLNITGDMSDGQLRVENRKYEEQIEEYKDTIKYYEKQIEDLQLTIDDKRKTSQSDKDTIDELNNEIDDLNDEIEELKTTISDLKLELAEAQYRADMYQKFPFWEY